MSRIPPRKSSMATSQAETPDTYTPQSTTAAVFSIVVSQPWLETCGDKKVHRAEQEAAAGRDERVSTGSTSSYSGYSPAAAAAEPRNQSSWVRKK
ncbi:UNVERIFIED_CONTAM: hypothetical protein HDU68_011004 [Siphonaria sp. JEL0065]|nr:hypothetical protein HDU68_011004 [Siphonaria sp. JEL0065]